MLPIGSKHPSTHKVPSLFHDRLPQHPVLALGRTRNPAAPDAAAVYHGIRVHENRVFKRSRRDDSTLLISLPFKSGTRVMSLSEQLHFFSTRVRQVLGGGPSVVWLWVILLLILIRDSGLPDWCVAGPLYTVTVAIL
jgi:hypothetical protein